MVKEYGARVLDLISVSESSKATGTHNYDAQVPEGAGKVVIAVINLTDVDPDGDATNGTLAVTLKESEDGSTWSNIAGGATGTLSSAGVTVLTCLKSRAKPHVRAEAVVGTDVVDYTLEVVALA